MKRIRNTSYTGRYVHLKANEGPKSIWLTPGESIVVPDSFVSKTAKNMAKRRIFKIQNA
jgi:hypothetical protein